jgi:hypothetical protein
LKDETTSGGVKKVSRSELIELLNQDLAREYQAIIAYVVYSQVTAWARLRDGIPPAPSELCPRFSKAKQIRHSHVPGDRCSLSLVQTQTMNGTSAPDAQSRVPTLSR